MNGKLQRPVVAAFTLILCIAFLPSARAETPWSRLSEATRSASGQFMVTVQPDTAPSYRPPDTSANTNLMRLQAPWFVVSAERFRTVLWRELGLPRTAPWTGKIFVTLYSARSLDDRVIIAPTPFLKSWNCALELPDLISRNRYARALSAVLLLELANRNTPVTARSAELPAWLVDGLAREVIESDEAQAILSAPTKTVEGVALVGSGPTPVLGGLPESRVDKNKRGLDSLAPARLILHSSGALTFDQLSWPDDAQMEGKDGGVYLASAQLFVNELRALKNGPQMMRSMLAQLSSCQNWQTAFFRAFHEHFSTPLEAEKWWALRVVAFAARDPGPGWTLAASRQKLAALLTVPMGVRYDSNSLPVRVEMTMQTVIQNVDSEQRTAILETRLRDLELARLRVATPLAALVDGYCNVLTDFLGRRKGRNGERVSGKFFLFRGDLGNVKVLLKKLDELDARRRQIEARLDQKAVPVTAPAK